MDPLDSFLRAVGAFYLVGSYFGLRAILMDSVLDKALSAISASALDRKEQGRRLIVGSFTILFGAGGAALALLSYWALPVFVVSLAAQAVWLFWARRFFIPPEEDDDASVRQLRNSSVLYAAATLGVVWLWRDGRLGPWDDPLAAALIAATAIGLGGWFFWHLSWKPASPGLIGGFYDDGEAEPAPSRIIIDPARWLWPLVDADTGERFNHLTWFGDELAWRVEHWDDSFQCAFDPDDEMASAVFASPDDEARYLAEGEAIAEALKGLYGEDNVSFGPRWRGAETPGA